MTCSMRSSWRGGSPSSRRRCGKRGASWSAATGSDRRSAGSGPRGVSSLVGPPVPEGGVRFSSPHLRRSAMTAADRQKFLPLALRVVGLIFTFGFYPLTVLWPSGWAWHSSGRSEYLEMIVAVYATLGVFLLLGF